MSTHAPGCMGDAPQCGGEFNCPRCERTVGYCMGAGDDMPAVCDDCWLTIDSAPWKDPSARSLIDQEGKANEKV